MRKIAIITTGGTIEKTYDEEDGTLFNRETIIKKRIEERLRLPYTQLSVSSIMAKDSLDMQTEDRKLILKAIELQLELCDGIVVLHGTDTMQQTAELVQASLPLLSKPVIFTGAMRPLGFLDSDALQNVVESIYAAKIAEPAVYISFHSELYPVPGVRKNKDSRTFEKF